MEFVESTEVEEVMQNLQIGAEDVNEHVCRLDLAEQTDLTRHELKLEPEQRPPGWMKSLAGSHWINCFSFPPESGPTFSMPWPSAWRRSKRGRNSIIPAVHRNGRDPVLCHSADLPLLRRLIEILARDGEGDEQSLQVLTPSSRMVLEVSPPDRLRAAFADPVRWIWCRIFWTVDDKSHESIGRKSLTQHR